MNNFNPFQSGLLDYLHLLPDEYAEQLMPPYDRVMVLTCKEQKVGDMRITLHPGYTKIRIGDHTEIDFEWNEDAVKFIRDVVGDDFVFHFHDGEVDYYRFDEITSLRQTDHNFYVWSGPFRYVFIERQNKR